MCIIFKKMPDDFYIYECCNYYDLHRDICLHQRNSKDNDGKFVGQLKEHNPREEKRQALEEDSR